MTNTAGIRSGRLAGLSMGTAIRVLAVPVLVQQLMSACLGLMDTIFAGRLPKDVMIAAMDAVGVGSYVTWLTAVAMTGLGAGGQAVIARAMGAGNRDESQLALGNAVVVSLAWGVVVGLAMWFFVYPLGPICGLTPEARRLLHLYVQIIACSMPFAGLMLVGSMCLHGAGETTWPSLIAVGANVVNIVASWALSGVDLDFGPVTLANPFPFDLGLAGIALGTSLSFAFGGVATLWVLRRGVKDMRLERETLALSAPMTWRIVRVGLPAFLDSIMMWGANIIVLFVIGQVAASGSADGQPAQGLQGAHLIAIRWESISFLPGFALGTAAGALAGQYLGAGSPALARSAMLKCLWVGSAVMGALGLLFIFGGAWLTRIVSGAPVHLVEVPKLLLIAGMVQAVFAVTLVLRQGLRGAGDTRWSFYITTFSSFLIRLPLAWLFGVRLGGGLSGVWIGLCGEIVIRSALFAWRFWNGGWMRVAV